MQPEEADFRGRGTVVVHRRKPVIETVETLPIVGHMTSACKAFASKQGRCHAVLPLVV